MSIRGQRGHGKVMNLKRKFMILTLQGYFLESYLQWIHMDIILVDKSRKVIVGEACIEYHQR